VIDVFTTAMESEGESELEGKVKEDSFFFFEVCFCVRRLLFSVNSVNGIGNTSREVTALFFTLTDNIF